VTDAASPDPRAAAEPDAGGAAGVAASAASATTATTATAGGVEPEVAYPVQWEAYVLASDGGIVHVRPVRPDDADQLVALHARLSDRTRYLRYFGAYPRISPRDLYRSTHVDHDNRVVLVAETGGEIVAVSLYDRLAGTTDAEVAFLVEDAQQGRGIGSVLLEHLAAAARERGVRRFVAEVLAENPRMVRVFLDAGYFATHQYEQAVVHLTFPIEPTEESVAVAYERERRAEARSVERLLTPRSVAVVGASSDPGKVGAVVFHSLLGYGFQGPIYPVHPTATHVGGVPAYPSVMAVPGDVDLAVVAVPAAAVPQVVQDCAHKKVRGLVVVSGGFGERGGAGAAAERDLVAAARANGMRVVGPNCLGVVNSHPDVRLNATLAPLVPGRGRVGFFCQSGALGVAILETASRRGLGLSTFVSAGNRADLSGNDLLQYWEGDPDTDVVLLYLESFGNPRKFARLARRLARRKPVVAVKTGRYGSVAPGLATRSVPVPDEAVQAIFEATGVIRVETLTGMFDVASLLAYQPLPAGPVVAVVTNSSALGVLVVDACRQAGLTVAGDPLDIGPDGTVADFVTALRVAVAAADAVVAVFVPPLATSGLDYAPALAEVATVAAEQGTPIVSTFLGTEGVPDALARIGPDGTATRGSIPSYPTPERAVRALARAVRYAQWRRKPVGVVPDLPGVDADAGERVVTDALTGSPAGRALSDVEAAALLTAYGIPRWPGEVARTADEAVAIADRLGYPVAVKALAEQFQHRPDLGGVRLDLADAAAVRAAWSALPATGIAASGAAASRAAASVAAATETPAAETPTAGAADAGSVASVTEAADAADAGAADAGAAASVTEAAGAAGTWAADAEAVGTEPAAAAGVPAAGGAGAALVQPMAPPGVATVVGVVDDPSFGALVSFGVGGVATELLGDRAYAAVPLSDVDAAALVRAPRAAPLLSGYRGAEPVDTTALQDLLLRLARLAEDRPEVLELELNPVLVGPAGLAVLAADIRVGPPTARADPGPRRLV
jgi:acyl-CoA synthetase (NDP forming)/GNAT superfamily N-acetyltransferase